MRLDIYLVQQGFAQSRGRAQDMIDAGKVSVNGTVASKASIKINPEAEEEKPTVVILKADHGYVSRSALKLKGLLEELPANLIKKLAFKDKVVMDIGASTGGFSQVALEYGASHVYCVDVGSQQLHESIRDDGRVTVCEQQDGRELMSHMFDFLPKILIIDVSFISLTKIIPSVIEEFAEIKSICALVKPQFELDKSSVGKGGLVKNEEGRQRALNNVKKCFEELGFNTEYEMESALAGGDGNREYMIFAHKEI